MDKYEGLMHVLTLAVPPLEAIADSKQSVELAKMANDGMAELVSMHPDRFAGAVAALLLNNIDTSLEELDRAFNALKFRGIQIFTNINDNLLTHRIFCSFLKKWLNMICPYGFIPGGSIT